MNMGATPLYIAAQNGHLEVARLLLDATADKDKAMNMGATPLFVAAQNGHLEVARLLLDATAELIVQEYDEYLGERSSFCHSFFQKFISL